MTTQWTPPTEQIPVVPPQPAPRDPARRRTIILLVAFAVALVAILAYATVLVVRNVNVAPAAAAPAEPTAFVVSGALSLANSGMVYDTKFYGTGTFCSGSGGYSDVTGGAAVTITDASGTIVATTNLVQGSTRNGVCVFNFTAPQVPRGSAFYSVEVSHRGTVTFPAEQIQAGQIELSLGTG